MQQINLNNLSDDAQLTMAELETSKVKNRRGITRLSGSQIRRLEAQGIFPKSRQMVIPPFLIELMGRKSKALLLFKNRWTTIY